MPLPFPSSGVALQASFNPLPVFSVTLEHSHELPVAAFHITRAESSRCDRDLRACKA